MHRNKDSWHTSNSNKINTKTNEQAKKQTNKKAKIPATEVRYVTSKSVYV